MLSHIPLALLGFVILFFFLSYSFRSNNLMSSQSIYPLLRKEKASGPNVNQSSNLEMWQHDDGIKSHALVSGSPRAVRPPARVWLREAIIPTWAVTKVRLGGLYEAMRRAHKLLVLGWPGTF